MTISSISIENNVISIKNHNAYSSPSPSTSNPPSYSSTTAVTLGDFNFGAAGDWGYTSNTIDRLVTILL